jgi:hypothetical protein
MGAMTLTASPAPVRNVYGSGDTAVLIVGPATAQGVA